MPRSRRTALTALTAEQQAFLRPELIPAPTQGQGRPRNDAVTRHHTALIKQAALPAQPATSKQRGKPLRSVTLRLTPEVAVLLRRASIERSLEYDEPYTQQGIMESALRDWLVAQGYQAG